MVRPKADDLAEELKKDELNTDGSESSSGSATVPGESTADTSEMIKEAYGNEPTDPDGFISGLEANKDEDDIQHGTKSYEELDEEGDEEEELKGSALDEMSEDAETPNPYDKLGEEDDTDETSEE